MKKLSNRGMAKVIEIARKQREVRTEVGVDAAKNCIYIKMSGVDPCVAMTAERAEVFAQSIMEFVYELRNGGQIG